MFFVTTGRLCYYSNYCVAYIDKEITSYYREMIPKAVRIQSPAFPAHVTVIRKDKEVAPTDEQSWGKYQDVEVPIYYEPTVKSGGPYYWLEAMSPQLNFIRQELGLREYRFPFGCFHITVGNTKGGG